MGDAVSFFFHLKYITKIYVFRIKFNLMLKCLKLKEHHLNVSF